MQILLRKVEGASVVLVCDDEYAKPEMLQTRYDLFRYRGGVAWGYKGTGAQSLSYAIAGRLSEEFPEMDIHTAASELLSNVLSKLDEEKEHTINHDTLLDAVSFITLNTTSTK